MTTLDVNVLRESISKVTRILSGRGINVTQRGSSAYVESNKKGEPVRVNLPYIPDTASEGLINAINGFLDHEVGHLMFTDFKVVTKASRKGKAIAEMLNFIEDTFVEKSMIKRFRGSAANLDNVGKFFLEKYTTPKVEGAIVAGDQQTIMGSLIVPAVRAWAGQGVFVDYMKDKWELIPELTDNVDDDLREQIANVKSTQDSLDAAIKLHEALTPKKPESDEESDDKEESDEKPKPSKKDGGRKGESDEDKGKKGADDEGEESTEPTDEEDEGEGEGSAPAPSKGGDDEADDEEDEGDEADEFPTASDDDDEEDEADDDDDESGADEEADEADDGDEDDEVEGDEEEEGEGEEESESDGGDEDEEETELEENEFEPDDNPPPTIDPEDLEDIVSGSGFDEGASFAISRDSMEESADAEYLVYTKEFDVIGPPVDEMKHYKDHMLESLDDTVRHVVGPLQKNLERLIMAKQRSRWTPGLRSGRVNASSLYKLKTGDDRVFRRRQTEGKTKDVAVTVLMDLSGSMSHNARIERAVEAGYAMGQVLSRVGVDFELLGFTTKYQTLNSEERKTMNDEENKMGRQYSRYDRIYMPVFKSFTERFGSEQKKRMAVTPHYLDMSGNLDGESVEYACERLMKRPNERKVLFVLSDGQPAAMGDFHAQHWHLVSTVKKFSELGIDIFGIGIETDVVKNFYPDYAVLNDVSSLPTTLMEQLRRVMLD